jgi:CubicO group peptidase (beta-lactamase class C family)
MKPLILIALLFASISFAEETQKVSDLLKPVIAKHQLAGAVTLVADKEKILALDAVGAADVAAKQPMTTDTIFWIASMSKPMTTTAFMMLVDEGKVSLDDLVEKYLPEFKDVMVLAEKDGGHMLLRKPAHPVLVRNVLSHTSGIVPRSPLEPQIDILPLRENVRVYPLVPLHFEPGTKYEYSNGGINTAGRIIEVISGMKYEDFMQKRLFDPLGMTDTTFWPSEAQMERGAKSYKADKDKTGIEETTVNQLTYPLTNRTRAPCPAGGLFSTATDCAKFCQMLLNGGEYKGTRLLSAEGVKQLTRRQTPAEVTQSYGFGFSVTPDSFGHGGAYATNMNVDTKRGLITVWMVQNSGFPKDWPNAQAMFKRWAERRFGR